MKLFIAALILTGCSRESMYEEASFKQHVSDSYAECSDAERGSKKTGRRNESGEEREGGKDGSSKKEGRAQQARAPRRKPAS